MKPGVVNEMPMPAIADRSQLAVQQALQLAAGLLREQSETPHLDAQVLLAHLVERPRAWVLANPESPLSPSQAERFSAALAQIRGRIPLPYLLGRREFFGLDFAVTPETLIPRPETELLVENALRWLEQNPQRRRAADVGAGSGCIGISLAKQIPDLWVLATDISCPALGVARANAQQHRVADRVRFVQGNLLGCLARRPVFDLVCANLPYIPTQTLETLEIYGREPTLAVDGGPDGLSVIRNLLDEVPRLLAPGGLLILEIDTTQGESGLKLMQEHFPCSEISLIPDWAGHARLLRIQT